MFNWKSIAIFGIVSLGLFGCSTAQENATTEAKAPETNQNEQISADENKEQNGTSQEIRTYVNQTDAWMLELPSTWNDVHIVESGRMTEFIFPSQNPDYKQSLFWINTISEEEWEKAQAEGPTGSTKEITRKNGDVYLYYTPLDQVLEDNELKRYEEMVKDIPKIIESFKFE